MLKSPGVNARKLTRFTTKNLVSTIQTQNPVTENTDQKRGMLMEVRRRNAYQHSRHIQKTCCHHVKKLRTCLF